MTVLSCAASFPAPLCSARLHASRVAHSLTTFVCTQRTPARRLTGQALLDSMPNIGSGTVLKMEEAAANARLLPALEAAGDVGVGTTLRMEAAAARFESAGPRFSPSAASAAALRALPAITEDQDQHAEAPPAAVSVPGTRQVLMMYCWAIVNCLCIVGSPDMALSVSAMR